MDTISGQVEQISLRMEKFEKHQKEGTTTSITELEDFLTSTTNVTNLQRTPLKTSSDDRSTTTVAPLFSLFDTVDTSMIHTPILNPTRRNDNTNTMSSQDNMHQTVASQYPSGTYTPATTYVNTTSAFQSTYTQTERYICDTMTVSSHTTGTPAVSYPAVCIDTTTYTTTAGMQPRTSVLSDHAMENLPLNPYANTFNPPTKIRIYPKEYDGKEPWVIYRRHFDTVARANAWSLQLKALYLAPHLRGTALNFFNTLEEKVQNNFERLSHAFAERFSDEYRQSVAHTQLRGRVQKAQESLSEFATDVQRLVYLAFSDCPESARNRIALGQFLDGLWDTDVQQRVRDTEPYTLEAALAHAIKVAASRDAVRLSRRHARANVAAVQETLTPTNSNRDEPSGNAGRLV